MAVTTTLYQNALLHLAQGGINWPSDAIKCALCTSSYTPDFAAHAHFSDVTNELGTANGYTAGGAAVTGLSASIVVAASAPAWTVATVYTPGQIVRKVSTNGHIYRCVVGGTSHGSTEPTWLTTAGGTCTDNTVTWAECGSAYLKLAGTGPSWATSTITARKAIIYDSTPGTAATNPLVACVDYGADVSTISGTFAAGIDATYGIAVFPLL